MERTQIFPGLPYPPIAPPPKTVMPSSKWLEWAGALLSGPTRFMVLSVAFELNLVSELIKDPRGLTMSQIMTVTGINDERNAQHFINCCLAIDLIFLNSARFYINPELDDDLLNTYLPVMVKGIHWVLYRQAWYFKDALVNVEPAGVKNIYGAHHKNLYTACETEPTLYESWTPMMDMLTNRVENRMLPKMDYPSGCRVLDCAGQTGVGATLLLKFHQGKNIHCTVLDQHWKEQDCLKRFADNDISECTSFVAGDVFDALPTGYDIIQFKHFINMFSDVECKRFLRNAFDALPSGGKCMTFTYHYPEDIVLRQNAKDSICFMVVYFVAVAMGRGGYWKISEVQQWMFEVGFASVEVIHVESPHSIVMGIKA
jgi:ubiquinone/menaquinone biosynthesis C-methylase UbiE